MTKTISIAMGTFNGARFLAEQLDSILAQNRLPDELVVCDDRSSDRTPDILASFAESAPFAVRIHRNESQLGWFANFLQASSKCGGDLIAFCDQDDVWLPEKLARCEEILTSGDRPSLVMHAARVVDERLNPTGTLHPHIRQEQRLRPRDYPTFVGGPGFAMCFERRLLDYLREPPLPAETALAYGHDTLLVLLAGANNGLYLLDEPLALYRRHGGNASGYEQGPASRLLRRRRQSDVDRLLETRAAVEDKAAVLRWLGGGDRLDRRRREALHGLEATHLRFAALLEQRAGMYRPGASAVDRSRCLARAIRAGGYSGRAAGSLGKKALVKDLLAAGTGFVYRG
jgi:glycosyltransferase involved in cell wall biosynthesis